MSQYVFLFDFGETLFQPLAEFHENRNLCNTSERLNNLMSEEKFIQGFRSYRKHVVRRFSTQPFFLHRDLVKTTLKEYLQSLNLKFREEDLEFYCEAQRSSVINYLVPRQSCVSVLTRLKQLGYDLGIVSNIDNDWLDPIVKHYSLETWFDLILTSEEAKSCKPHHTIFQIATSSLNRTPHECIFVGDSEIHDIKGAKEFGMKTIRLQDPNSREDTEADYVVTSLAQIPDRVLYELH